MKTVKLSINNSDKLRFNLTFLLDSVQIRIERKLASSEWFTEITFVHQITKDTDIHAHLENAFDEYLKKKDIEMFWVKAFDGTSVIEIEEKKLD